MSYITDDGCSLAAYSRLVSSRLATGVHGEVLVEITTPEVGQEVGQKFVALGNDLAAGPDCRFRWLGDSKGRPPTVEEQVADLDRLGRRRHGASHRGPKTPTATA
jgi:hypothetical protein